MKKKCLGIMEAYSAYKNKVKKSVNYSIYNKIVTGYSKYIVNRIMNGEKISLPNRLGHFEVIGKKSKIEIDEIGNLKGHAPNWPETKKLHARCPECKERGEKIYFLNEHSNQIRYKWRWSTRDMNIYHKHFYSFKLSRPNQRRLSNNILTSNVSYYIKDNKYNKKIKYE